MIKIIKHGDKVFKMICPHCGCEFTYEQEDVNYKMGLYLINSTNCTSYSYVECPDCGHECYLSLDDISRYPKPIKVYYDKITTDLDCDQCPWNYKWGDGSYPYVGDTPCTWCKKRQVTCTLTGSNNIDGSK